MGSFGERLRREREMRGISLDEIATATKISARNLRALEEEKFNQLPGGIFNKGFVRAYAKFLGIDEDQMVAEYVTASHDIESAREQKFNTELSKAEFKRLDKEREISLEPKSQWGTIAVIVLIAAGGFGGYEYYQKRKAQRQAQAQIPAPVTTTQAVTPPPPPQNQTPTAPPATDQTSSPTLTPSTTDATKPADASKATFTTSTGVDASQPKSAAAKPNDNTAAKPGDSASGSKPSTAEATSSSPIDVKIHANQKSWVSIIADGKTVMEGILPESSEKAVRAKDQVVIVLGNVGGVEVSYNGKTLENLGKGAEVKKLTFTPSGYQ